MRHSPAATRPLRPKCAAAAFVACVLGFGYMPPASAAAVVRDGGSQPAVPAVEAGSGEALLQVDREVPLPERLGLHPLGVAAISSFGWPLGLGHALVGEWPRGMLWGGLGMGLLFAAEPIYGNFYISPGFARRQLGWAALMGGVTFPLADAWSVATEARKAEARRAVASMSLPVDRKAMLAEAVVKVPEDALVASLYATAFTYATTWTRNEDIYGWSFLTAVPGWTISQLAYRPLVEALPVALVQAGIWTAAVHAIAARYYEYDVLYLIPAVYSAWEAWHHTAEAREAGIRAALAPSSAASGSLPTSP